MELIKNKGIDLNNINSIVIIMFGLLGDVFMRTIILKALKELFPGSIITAIVDPIGKQVLENNIYCDNIVIVDRSKKNRYNYYLNKLKTIFTIRNQNPDLIVDLYNGGSSPFIVFTSSAKYRLGYQHQKDKSVYNLRSNYIPYINKVIDSYNKQVLSILQPLTDKNFSLKPIFQISEDALVTMRNYVTKMNLSIDKVYVLNLGSGGEEKLLDNEIYFKIIEYIFRKYDFIPAIVRNPSQEYLQDNLINEYLKSSDIKYIRLKSLSIDEVAAIIEMSRFIITPDTGLMHLSFALEVYSFTIFTYTNPKLVDLGSEKFISVFDKFDAMQLFQKQDITLDMICNKIDNLFEKIL